MNNTLSGTEVLEVLNAIERGELTLNADDVREAVAGYCGDFRFRVSNGWEFTIFNDCGEWDYIDFVLAPDGRNADFNHLWDFYPEVRTFQPMAGKWGIDG